MLGVFYATGAIIVAAFICMLIWAPSKLYGIHDEMKRHTKLLTIIAKAAQSSERAPH